MNNNDYVSSDSFFNYFDIERIQQENNHHNHKIVYKNNPTLFVFGVLAGFVISMFFREK